MVEGKLKSRTFRRIYTRTPGGKPVIHYKRRKPSRAHCASCGALLHGVATGQPRQISKLSKTERRPERPYGGELCSKCARARIISKALSAKQ